MGRSLSNPVFDYGNPFILLCTAVRFSQQDDMLSNLL